MHATMQFSSRSAQCIWDVSMCCSHFRCSHFSASHSLYVFSTVSLKFVVVDSFSSGVGFLLFFGWCRFRGIGACVCVLAICNQRCILRSVHDTFLVGYHWKVHSSWTLFMYRTVEERKTERKRASCIEQTAGTQPYNWRAIHKSWIWLRPESQRTFIVVVAIRMILSIFTSRTLDRCFCCY